jgi:hypothetical protein
MSDRDIEYKRQAILKAYPHSGTWPAKVAKMSDNQVLAVYSRLMRKANDHIKSIKERGTR